VDEDHCSAKTLPLVTT